MESEPRRGEWMMPLLSDFLGVSGEALRILDDPDVTDRWLLIRRLAEYEIRRGPADEIGDQVFRMAAAKLREQDDEDGARAMDEIAAAGDALKNTDLDWLRRYDARPVTTAEHAAADLLAKGVIWPDESPQVTGIDGAVYSSASLARDSGDPLAVVMAIMHTGEVEIVSGFGDAAERDAWLADRSIGRAVPADGLPSGDPPVAMSGAVTGPDCRTQHEERILAWLLQGGAVDEGIRSLEPHAFSTYSRSEIYLAWRSVADSAGDGPAPGEVRHELARRLLRAPAWADKAVGWPFGHHALAYFDRLAATPITRDQAESAAGGLIREAALAPELVGRPGESAPQTPVVRGLPVSGPEHRPPEAEASDCPTRGPSPGT